MGNSPLSTRVNGPLKGRNARPRVHRHVLVPVFNAACLMSVCKQGWKRVNGVVTAPGLLLWELFGAGFPSRLSPSTFLGCDDETKSTRQMNRRGKCSFDATRSSSDASSFAIFILRIYEKFEAAETHAIRKTVLHIENIQLLTIFSK